MNINANHLCYVASGLNFAGLDHRILAESKEARELVCKWFERLNDNHSHKFSVLYNAFTEGKKAKRDYELYKPHVHDIHSDSGGLQIISRGFTATPERKKKIYQIQGKYSDVAMSFDEIPVYTLIESSELKDSQYKVFERSKLEPCAKETAKNITEQIQSFLDNKSKTKPLAVIHGNDLETAMIWSEILFREIPQSMHEAIGGVAIGSPALGTGELEEVKKAFWFTQIPFDLKEKHLHLLGVGATSRIAPVLFFIKSGLISDTFISYDSSTHMGMNIRGRYYYGSRPDREYQIAFNRQYTKDYEEVYTDIISNCPELEQHCGDSKEFHRLMNSSPVKDEKERGTGVPVILCTVAHAVSCIHNFTKHVEASLEDDEVLYKIVEGNDNDLRRSVYQELYKVKSLDDYKYWETHLGRFLKSNPSRSNLSTLDQFF